MSEPRKSDSYYEELYKKYKGLIDRVDKPRKKKKVNEVINPKINVTYFEDKRSYYKASIDIKDVFYIDKTTMQHKFRLGAVI